MKWIEWLKFSTFERRLIFTKLKGLETMKKIVGFMMLLISMAALTSCQSKVDENLPEYKIMFQVELASGKGVYADILMPSYSKETPKETREATLRSIMTKEGFVSASLYSTEEARKAAFSDSYKKENPTAMDGFLGTVSDEGLFLE